MLIADVACIAPEGCLCGSLFDAARVGDYCKCCTGMDEGHVDQLRSEVTMLSGSEGRPGGHTLMAVSAGLSLTLNMHAALQLDEVAHQFFSWHVRAAADSWVTWIAEREPSE